MCLCKNASNSIALTRLINSKKTNQSRLKKKLNQVELL